MDTPDTLAANTKKSLIPLDGKSHRLSVQGAACLSSMLTGKQSSENCEQVLVLLTLLLGITTETTSGDVLALGMYRARDMCRRFGVDETVFEETVERFAQFAGEARRWNPLAF